jgi:polyhydroxyalkanoate synthase
MAGKKKKTRQKDAEQKPGTDTKKVNAKADSSPPPNPEQKTQQDASEQSLADMVAKADPEKLEALSKNLTEALFESQEILREATSRQMKTGLSTGLKQDPFGTNKAMMKVGEELAKHPENIMSAQMKLWEGHVGLWRSFLTNDAETPSKDRRFSDAEWRTNPMFDLIRRTYELNTQWLFDIINDSDTLDEGTRRKAKFFAQQTADAFSPTNFFSTNPAALKAMLETGGKSVLEGLKLAHEDIRRGHGRLLISQTDGTAFEVGKNIATSPGKVVYRNELIEIIQYEPKTTKAFEIPLLIFPPWINKFYILDLRQENSMIRWLVENGYSVFVVSWRSADHSMADFTWDHYVKLGAYDAVEAVCKIAESETVNAVGYCIGGTMLNSALAHMALHDDNRIASATYFASQSDFQEAGDLLVFTDEDSLQYVESLIDSNDGIMAGEDMAETFNYLRPSDLVWRYVVDSYMLGKKPRPFDLLYWNGDQTNIPGKTHLTYLKDLYGQNALAKGEFMVLGERVNLKDIEIPMLYQAGRDDHISPFRSVYKVAQAVGGNAEFVLAGSGHIAGVINHPDAKKYQYWVNADLPDSPDEWLEGSEEIPGSWWPHWHKWLKKRSGKKVEARVPEDVGLGPAPGKYVKLKLEDLGVGPLAK